MDSANFARRLELTLKALSISRGRLASDLGVDKSVVARWLNGATAPTDHNLARLTSFVAAHRPGFTMLDWDAELGLFEAKVGAREAAPASVAGFGDWPPVALMRAAATATAARGEAYEGFWRSTRLANDPPGRFMHDPIMIRRDPDGLLRSRMGVREMRFEGVAFINQTQLFSMVVDAESGIFVFSILNTVPRQRAQVMDGLTLTCTQASGGSPVAALTYMERVGALSGDPDRDAARFETHLAADPLIPEGGVPEAVRAHLLGGAGTGAGVAMLALPFARTLASAIDFRATSAA